MSGKHTRKVHVSECMEQVVFAAAIVNYPQSGKDIRKVHVSECMEQVVLATSIVNSSQSGKNIRRVHVSEWMEQVVLAASIVNFSQSGKHIRKVHVSEWMEQVVLRFHSQFFTVWKTDQKSSCKLVQEHVVLAAAMINSSQSGKHIRKVHVGEWMEQVVLAASLSVFMSVNARNKWFSKLTSRF